MAFRPAKSCRVIGRVNVAAAALGATLGMLITAPCALAQNTNVIVEWNQILQSVSSSWRPYAMVHIAMFDAVNSIERAYTPYRVRVRASSGASQKAAAAQAARDVLTALFPAQQQTFDSALTSQLAGIPPGLAEQGRSIGRQAAQGVLAWRQNDGWPAVISPDPAYALPPFPGLWQPTPPGNSPATFTFYRDALPFALVSSTQFLPPPPPSVTSARYAADFNEVKERGSAASVARTPEETLLAQLIAGVTTSTPFMSVWNNVARDIAEAQGFTVVETARLFALVNVSLNDGLQTSFSSKFVYDLWRPVTAIRRADEDLNAATVADQNWTPLLATPPYPTYAGNMACLAAAAARALALTVGRDDIPFSVTWIRTMGLPNETRHYSTFSQLAHQQARSRIHGGIHFQFDSDASELVCPKIAEYTHANFMLPR
jgi:hypothetical protein